nr:MAG TPA: hypothetical protein [Caudoviricetes sp.]
MSQGLSLCIFLLFLYCHLLSLTYKYIDYI